MTMDDDDDKTNGFDNFFIETNSWIDKKTETGKKKVKSRQKCWLYH